MRRLMWMIAGALTAVTALALAAVVYVQHSGLEGRSQPGAMEAALASRARRLAVPASARGLKNPLATAPDAIADGMVHFADHCASCHANDGSGNTELGRGFYPKAPDMRMPATQALSDGELFYVIENGIRFTGMPAWGTGTTAGEASTWRLVAFIRHLPGLTEPEIDRMKELNPRSQEDIRQEIEEERFLNEVGTPSRRSGRREGTPPRRSGRQGAQ